ncbi:MAG: NADP-dependent isocitrate dehydrogenase [Prevotella sp.]|nr:NADP-dependent isocitrate dehydrogenase [Prevotella sp.]MCI2081250.1 NADP-dependent isocitrate dehydrogenase [Prevotella sp.]MCI2101322.1 NADP-dependent isocitrate dehydrogenase [Prevotella sp.]
MEKIKMTTPLVEMDGDEMTRILWKKIKEELILPFVDLKSEYYDLGLVHRDETSDRVTVEAAEACKKYGVGVKCATITPNAKRMEEYHLHKMWKSPNGTIRSILDGTVFRTPITIPSIHPVVKNWEKPITIARHAYGDVYKNVELRVDEPGTAKLVFEGKSGKRQEAVIHTFESPGVIQGLHNVDRSIRSFAHSCFQFALDTHQDLWFATKDTISKTYDAQFREIFEELYENEYKVAFEKQGITYFYTLIDDAVARVIRSKGGFIWACKNYDGDVMSDMVSTAFGSLAMMTSVLVTPDGNYEYEAAHGTVTRHYYRYLQGEETSTNPMATIFAWSGALRKRGEKDGLPQLARFADQLEKACLDTLNEGTVTKDLVGLMEGMTPTQVNSADFMKAIRNHLECRLNASCD